MRQVLAIVAFMLATLVWAMAQQPGANGGQSTSPNSQSPSATQSQPSQSQPSAPSTGSQDPAQSSQSPNANQSQSSQPGTANPGTANQGSAQSPDSSQRGSAQSGAGTPGQGTNAPITEGCLGGTNPNFTITDKAGTTYKLNIPPGADASVLTPHVGESVQVMGPVTNGGGATKASSIDVSKIGRGTGNCPGNNSKQPK